MTSEATEEKHVTDVAVRGARLEISDITMSFGGARALGGVSLVALPATVHAVIGPNGAGKSTLMNVVSGIYRPSAGRITLDGEDLLGKRPERVAAAGVGRAFQNASMFGSLSVAENLMLGRHCRLRAGVFGSGFAMPWARAEEARARTHVEEVAKFFEIEHLLGRSAGSLPYGDAKRVDVARAMCANPRVLLLDEPVAGVTPEDKKSMARLIRRIVDERHVTVVLVEHDMGLVMRVSDEITVLNFGTVLAEGTPSQVQRDPAVVEAYLGGSLGKERANALASETTGPAGETGRGGESR